MAEETEDGPAMVPSARLREETAAKRAAMSRAAELEVELAKLTKTASTADTLAKQLEEVRGNFQAAASAWEEERAVYHLGVTDPEAVSVARHFHSQLTGDSRPKFSDWLKSAKEDPSKAPKALAVYLTPPTPSAPAATSTPSTGQRPAATAPAATATKLESDQIRQLREECARTGDWSRWTEARAAIMASVK